MNITQRWDKDTMVIGVEGTLDINSALELRDQSMAIDKALTNGSREIVLDMNGLDLIDSSGVGALVTLYKHTRSKGAQFNVVGARNQPLAIFKLLRMDKVFGI